MSVDEPLRILCMGDNHGNTSSLKRVVKETEGEEFDFIVHVGDITNAWFDGISEGAKQLEATEPYFETLEDRGELVYIWGNRDGRGPEHVTDLYSFEVGTYVPPEGTTTIAGQSFTQKARLVEEDTILLNHYLDTRLLDFFVGRAYFSGHVHVGRYKNNCLNSAFLYRDDSHGATGIEGGYFIVEIDSDGTMQIEPRLWNLKKGICVNHICRGVQFVPEFWKSDCKFDYDDEEYYGEIAESAFYALLEEGDFDVEDEHKKRSHFLEAADFGISPTQLIERGQKICSSTPRDFNTRFSSFVEERYGSVNSS